MPHILPNLNIEETGKTDGLTLADKLSLQYSIREEMALIPTDFLMRRINHILFMRDTLDTIKQPVINEMANFYNWTAEEKANFTQELERVIDESDLSTLKGADDK